MTDTIQHNKLTDQILKIGEVCEITKLSKNTLYNLARKGLAPRPLKLSKDGRASGFLLSEINAFLAERVAERDAKGGKNNAAS